MSPIQSVSDDLIDLDLGESHYGGQKALEDQLTNEIIDVIKEFIGRRFSQGRRPALRDAHAKDNGCVRATFCVDRDLKNELRIGVFKQPGREYQAWIRFSNGNSERRNSRFPDARGMAIKLIGVEGQKLLDLVEGEEKFTQDFILISSPGFFVDDLMRYKDVLQKFLSGGTVAQYLSAFKLRGWEIWLAIKVNLTLLTNPLFHQYWSMTPYRLGVPPGTRYAVKYTAKPSSSDPASFLQRLKTFFAPRFSLKREMNKRLSETDVSFDFFLQRYVDEDSTPIENTKIVWTETISKPEHVAKIIIPRTLCVPSGQPFAKTYRSVPGTACRNINRWASSIACEDSCTWKSVNTGMSSMTLPGRSLQRMDPALPERREWPKRRKPVVSIGVGMGPLIGTQKGPL